MNDDRSPRTEVAARSQLRDRLQQLSELLAEEFKVIRERDLARLESVARSKQTLVDEINAYLAEFAKEQPSDVELQLLDEENRALIEQCHRNNRRNGGALETCQSFTTALLDILHGRSPGQRTYTARGRLGPQRESFSLMRV